MKIDCIKLHREFSRLPIYERIRRIENFKRRIVGVFQEDWLVILYHRDGHQSVQFTECWPQWGRIGLLQERKTDRTSGYFERRQQAVINAVLNDPPMHNPEWCSLCNPELREAE